MANWLDKYEQGGLVLKQKTKDNYGKQSNYNDAKASVGPDFVGLGYNTKGRDYSPAWGGQFQDGGKLTLPEAIVYGHKDSKVKDYFDKVRTDAEKSKDDNGWLSPLAGYHALEQMHSKYGAPKINTIGEKDRPYYNPVNDSMNISIPNYYDDFADPVEYEFLDELAHKVQANKKGNIGFVKDFFGKDLINTLKNINSSNIFTKKGWLNAYEKNYDTLGTVENEAHSVIAPKLYEEYKDILSKQYNRLSGDMAMGGALPGAVGFMYARTQDPAPSNGKYAKKTKASAQNGSVIKDDRGQWAYPGEVTEIGSNDITMQGVDYPVLGVSDTGDTKMMQPNQDYKFDGEKVTEFPMAQDGKKLKNVKGESEKFLKGWMNSPMYNKMVNESIKKSPNTNDEILKQISREDQLNKMIQNPKSFITGDLNSDKPWYNSDRIMGEYNRDDYNITIDKNIDNDKLFETAVHELSHATDLAGGNIPRADVEKMWKYQKQREQEKGKLTKFFDNEEFNTYVGRPTETRARLNSIRALGKEQGVYNPFTEKIDKSKLDKIKSPNIIRDSQLDQLRKIYNDDQIIDLLNSVSKNDSNKLIPEAQDGGWLNKYK